MGLSRAEALEIARTGNPLSADAIRRQLAPTQSNPKPTATASVGGVAALAKSRTAGEMTVTERRYAERLDALKAAGDVLAWDWECDRLKLADPVKGGRGKWFKCDFTVIHADGRTSYDEVKGSWISDGGRERFRWLCDRYKRRWMRLWQWRDGAWLCVNESGNERKEGQSCH